MHKLFFFILVVITATSLAIDLGTRYTELQSDWGSVWDLNLQVNPVNIGVAAAVDGSATLGENRFYSYMPSIMGGITAGIRRGEWIGTLGIYAGGILWYIMGQGANDYPVIVAKGSSYAELKQVRLGGTIAYSFGRTYREISSYYREYNGRAFSLAPELYFSFTKVYTIGISLPVHIIYREYSWDYDTVKFGMEIENSWGIDRRGRDNFRLFARTGYNSNRFTVNFGFSFLP